MAHSSFMLAPYLDVELVDLLEEVLDAIFVA